MIDKFLGLSLKMKILVAVVPVIVGAVIVGGKDVREYDLETLRNEVAVVLQKKELF